MVKMYGFTFYLMGKDYFVKTEQANKTNQLATKVLQAINADVTSENINCMKFIMQKAICEVKHLYSCRAYYEISGDNFGGKGSFVDDGMTVIIKL